jgi:hypothetical protein
LAVVFSNDGEACVRTAPYTSPRIDAPREFAPAFEITLESERASTVGVALGHAHVATLGIDCAAGARARFGNAP